MLKKYAWEDKEEENLLKQIFKRDTSHFPKEKIVVLKTQNGFQKVYKITLYSLKPLSKKDYYVNVLTGKIERINERIHTTDVIGTAQTRYSGLQTITTDLYNSYYRLREAGRGGGIYTLNMQMTDNYAQAVDFTDDDNYWNNVNAQQDEVATDAHWATEKYYDYFLTTFNRNSIDNQGFPLYNYIHANLEAMGFNSNVNAFWDGQRMTFGDGNAYYSPLTTVDITAHEITHGLTEFTANLIYAGESGALNEAFSDIFGTVIEFYAKPTQANWTIGEDIGAAFRSLSNPNQYNDPDTYMGNYWDFNNEVHQNSTVLSHWFYLISVGGSGVNDLGNAYNVNAIGIDKAANIAYHLLVNYLPPNATYNDARFFAIIAASDLYGSCSYEVESVTNAMYAVGLGQPYVFYVVSDFTANITSTCEAPVTIQFQNLSVNGSSFLWNFGDGTTSTEINPQHTYMANGNYTVSLIAEGGSCGVDTLIKHDYISINPQNPCIIIMPLNGTGETITSCQGILYDGGGPAGNYADNSDAIITISPTGANKVTITFNTFDVEPGSANICDYDYVEIFDGTNTSSPSFGRYCNTTGNPGTIVSTGGALTILLHSDQALNKAGFEAVWFCEILNVAPVAQFTVTPINECSGKFAFIDHSLHNPTWWLWNFGDGTTSNLQNPIHEYANNGTYTVQLMVGNNFGSDTTVYQDFITVQRPDAPVVYNDTVCINESAQLIANSIGETYWYLNVNDTIPFFTGDTLNTSVLTNTTIFWAQNAQVNLSQYVGDTRSFSEGSYYNSGTQHYLNFNCYAKCTLVSVEVNAQTAGNRLIELKNASGITLQSKNVYIPAGINRITLNFELPVENNLKLAGPSYPNLWRNNNGAYYPYVLTNVLSITSSSASTNPYGYYYFFYNWEIKLPDCFSKKVPVVAYVDNCDNIIQSENNYIKIYPNPADKTINIVLPESFGITSFAMTNIMGIPIQIPLRLKGNGFSIETINLQEGVYLIYLSNNTQTFVYKVVINH